MLDDKGLFFRCIHSGKPYNFCTAPKCIFRCNRVDASYRCIQYNSADSIALRISQNISVTVTTDTADTDEAVENRVKAILTELLAVRRSRKLNELTLSDINHAIRSGYSGATNAAVSEPEADVKLGKDKVITLGDVSVTVERE